MSIEEAAFILGVPPNTVKTRMFYAREQLAGLIAELRGDVDRSDSNLIRLAGRRRR